MTRGGSGQAAAGRPVARRSDASLPFRALWFLVVGWWLGAIWLAVSWFLLVTVVGAPVGRKLLNGLPKVVTLAERRLVLRRAGPGPSPPREQPPLLLRAAYFCLLGWWLSAIWALVAHAFTVSVVGIPVGIWMYGRLPRVVSLYRC